MSVNRPEEGHHEALSFAGTDVLPLPQFGCIKSFYPKEKADDQFIIVILEMILDLNPLTLTRIDPPMLGKTDPSV